MFYAEELAPNITNEYLYEFEKDSLYSERVQMSFYFLLKNDVNLSACAWTQHFQIVFHVVFVVNK